MVVVHHLNNSRSQRVLWLLEELGVPYEVKRYERDAKTMLAPPELLAIHPLGKSPVIVDGAVKAFPARETAVLEILLRRSGNVAPKRLFEDHLFGLSGDVGSNAVEVYVHRLRKMLADAGATVKIHTVRGVGYLMAEEKSG